jgi:hypothetical protein
MATDQGETNKFTIHAACRDGQSECLHVIGPSPEHIANAATVNLAESLLNVRIHHLHRCPL